MPNYIVYREVTVREASAVEAATPSDAIAMIQRPGHAIDNVEPVDASSPIVVDSDTGRDVTPPVPAGEEPTAAQKIYVVEAAHDDDGESQFIARYTHAGAVATAEAMRALPGIAAQIHKTTLS